MSLSGHRSTLVTIIEMESDSNESMVQYYGEALNEHKDDWIMDTSVGPLNGTGYGTGYGPGYGADNDTMIFYGLPPPSGNEPQLQVCGKVPKQDN